MSLGDLTCGDCRQIELRPRIMQLCAFAISFAMYKAEWADWKLHQPIYHMRSLGYTDYILGLGRRFEQGVGAICPQLDRIRGHNTR